MATYKELLEAVADENLRKQLDEEYTKINRDAGERGRKLIEKDTELNNLKKEASGKSEWASTYKLLAEKGISPKDIPDMLDKMSIQKTVEDENKVLTALLKDSDSKKSILEKKVREGEVKAVIDKSLKVLQSQFKDKAGEPINIVEDFLDKGKLYADISDLNNTVLIEQRVNEVLNDGLQKQEAIKQKMGFQGAPTHQIQEGDGTKPVQGIAKLKEINEKEGPISAISAYLDSKTKK